MKRLIIFRILMALYIITVAYLLFCNGDSVPSLPKEIWGIPGDKAAHFLLFLPFPALVLLCREKIPSGFIDRTAVMTVIFLAGCGLAGLTELIQDFLPTRAAEWDDYKADVTATFLCSAITYFTLLGIPSKKHKK